jgi:hypothetical protein
MPAYLYGLLVLLFVYAIWFLVRKGEVWLNFFGPVSRKKRPKKFWFVVAFFALAAITNATLFVAKLL